MQLLNITHISGHMIMDMYALCLIVWSAASASLAAIDCVIVGFIIWEFYSYLLPIYLTSPVFAIPWQGI